MFYNESNSHSTLNLGNWKQRYASDIGKDDIDKEFESMSLKTLQKEANEKMNYHKDHLEYHKNAYEQLEEGDPLHILHIFAYDAHLLAHNAWNHIWNHIETPNEQYPDYNEAFRHSLTVHARDLSTHADLLSSFIKDEE